MDQNAMVKQMIQFNKATFDNSFHAMIMFQEQNEKMVNMLVGQATWLPEEGKKAINEWVSACQKGCANYKKQVDDAFKKVEEYFTKS